MSNNHGNNHNKAESNSDLPDMPEQSRGHEQSEQSDRNKPETLEVGAVSFDKQKRLDSSYYEAKYPDMKFMWILDTGGDVDKWLRAGAAIQKDEVDEQISGDTHGYRNKGRKGYVSVIGGTDFGVPVEQILLKMPKEKYAALITNPKHKRNQDIRDAMGMGKASTEDRDGSDVQTYAPNLPTGGVGFEQIAGKPGFNRIINKG